MVLLYLKLPFELHSTDNHLPTRHYQPAYIKVSLRADSSSLKVVGHPTMVPNRVSAKLFVWITEWFTKTWTRKNYLIMLKYADELLVVESLKRNFVCWINFIHFSWNIIHISWNITYFKENITHFGWYTILHPPAERKDEIYWQLDFLQTICTLQFSRKNNELFLFFQTSVRLDEMPGKI